MSLLNSQPWQERPTIDIDLNLPLEKRYKAFPPDAIRTGKTLIQAMPSVLPPGSEPFVNGVRALTAARFQPAALALAESLGLSWREIVLANISYDLMIGTMGCSTVVLPTSSGPVIARNMDFVPEVQLAQASYTLQYKKDGRTEFWNAAFPGTMGVVTALSSRGFAIILNAVFSPEGVNFAGYPVLLFLRTVMEDAANFDAALKLISEQPLAVAALITLVGTENTQRVVIERSPTRHALRWGEPGKPLMTTNHYRLLYPLGDDNPDQCSRYERLCGTLQAYDASTPTDDASLLKMLCDPAVIQEITAQHILIRPRQQELKLFIPERLMRR